MCVALNSRSRLSLLSQEFRKTSVMADTSELRMNLASIKRVDPYAKNIVDTSAHVAFYTFNSEENEWEKTDVEGAFFIYSRNAEPYHSIFINNRLNTNSFVEPITEQLELQAQPPFLLYRNERSRIRGFWFYNSAECDRIGDLVDTLIRKCEANPNEQKPQDDKPLSNDVNIFTLLTKAQEHFNNSKTPSVKKMPENKSQPDVTSQSVVNFFAAAKPAAASEVPLFQRLLSHPVSVEQIEKQQRTTTPQDGRGSPFALSMNKDLASPLSKFINSTNLSQNNAINAPKSSDLDCTCQYKSLQQMLRRDTSQPASATVSKPALMPPTMFVSSSSSKTNKNSESDQKQSTVAMKVINHSLDTVELPNPEPLTQTQLLQAMLYLIKNDPDFVKKLHEAYLKSFTEMVSS